MHGADSKGDIQTTGDHDDIAGAQSKTLNVSPSERRRLGRPYSKDKALEDVVASEMSRIRQAFDVRLGEHTEDLVGKVSRGEGIGEQTSGLPGKKK